jgi:Cu/Ag efflux protein CusF
VAKIFVETVQLNSRGHQMKSAAAQKTRTQTGSIGKVDEQIYKVGIAVVGISSLAIGVWATVALVSGMVASGGPGALVADWFRAVIGS